MVAANVQVGLYASKLNGAVKEKLGRSGLYRGLFVIVSDVVTGLCAFIILLHTAGRYPPVHEIGSQRRPWIILKETSQSGS